MKITVLPSRKECLSAIKKNESKILAARELGISKEQLRRITDYGFNEELNAALGKGPVRTLPGGKWEVLSEANAPTIEEEQLTKIEEHRLKKQVKELRDQIKNLLEEEYHNREFADFVGSVVSANRVQPDWLLSPRPGNVSPAIVTAMLSDIHYGEVINPDEIEGVNRYTTEIAKQRLENFFENTIRLSRDYISGVDIEGIVLLLGGDFISGNIHEELTETNQVSDYQAVLELSTLLADGIIKLAEEFEVVHVKAVPGNHARNSKKPRMKKRAINDLDWLVYHLTAKYVQDQLKARGEDIYELVTFDITEGSDIRYKLYDTTFVLTHGDQFRGGSGIASALSPLMIGDHRKRKRQQSIGKPYDWLIMGHWHQLMLGMMGIIVNGSLVGYNEYAYQKNLPFEQPQQALWLTDPEHGVTLRAPIHVKED